MLRAAVEEAEHRKRQQIAFGVAIGLAFFCILLLPGLVAKSLHDRDRSCDGWSLTQSQVAFVQPKNSCLLQAPICCLFSITFLTLNSVYPNSTSCTPADICVPTQRADVAPGYEVGTNHTLWEDAAGLCSINSCIKAFSDWRTYFWAPFAVVAGIVLSVLCCVCAAKGATHAPLIFRI